jgi:hypothetical protein
MAAHENDWKLTIPLGSTQSTGREAPSIEKAETSMLPRLPDPVVNGPIEKLIY